VTAEFLALSALQLEIIDALAFGCQLVDVLLGLPLTGVVAIGWRRADLELCLRFRLTNLGVEPSQVILFLLRFGVLDLVFIISFFQ